MILPLLSRAMRPFPARPALATATVALLAMAAPVLAQPYGGWGPPPGWGPGGAPGWGPPGGGWGGGPGGEVQRHGGKPSASIEVTGQGEASVAPDMAVVTLGVTVQAATAGEAMGQNAARQRTVIDTLMQRGIAPRDIQTSNLSLSPVQNYTEGQPPVITGYQAGNMVTVRIRDLPQLGPVLDALVAAGANEVQGVSFTREDAGETEAEARRRAVDNARERAEVIAEAAGQRLGRLVAITDTATANPPPRPMMMRAMAAEDSATPVQTGELSISAQVSVTWELVPARGDRRNGDGWGDGRRERRGPDPDGSDRPGADDGGWTRGPDAGGFDQGTTDGAEREHRSDAMPGSVPGGAGTSAAPMTGEASGETAGTPGGSAASPPAMPPVTGPSATAPATSPQAPAAVVPDSAATPTAPASGTPPAAN